MFGLTASRPLAIGACLAATLAAPAAAHATSSPADVRTSVQAAADWAESKQQATGNFSGFGNTLVPGSLAAAGRHPADVRQGANDPSSQEFLNTTFTSSAFTAPTNPATDSPFRPGTIAQSNLIGYAAGFDPARIAANQNLVAQLAGYYDQGYFNVSGPDERLLNYSVFGTLALLRVNAPRFLIEKGVAVIRDNQHNDGGWTYEQSVTDAERAQPSDLDTTGATLAALCESGLDTDDGTVQSGINYVRRNLNLETGVFGPQASGNANTNGAVISGLNACGIDPQGPSFTGSSPNLRTPVDFLRGLQYSGGTAQTPSGPSTAPDGTSNGGFYSPFASQANTADMYATQEALRALAGAAFTAAPPTRANPADPRRATVPAVADGTTVPISLAVDDGAGGVTFCRASVPSGASLATVLATANGSSTPGGCATGGEFTAGQLSKLNGQTGTWALSIDRGSEQVAASQGVRFGDFVALRRTSGATPAVPGGASSSTPPPAPVPAAQQAKTTPTGVSSKALKVSTRKRVVSLSLTCAKANRLCQGVAYVVYGKRTLGRRPFLIGGGKTTKVNVKLYKSAIKRLGKKKRKVKVNVFSRDGAGIASTSSRTLTLTPTK